MTDGVSEEKKIWIFHIDVYSDWRRRVPAEEQTAGPGSE